MVIIGFDPGSASFGIGLLKKEESKTVYLYSEEIKLKEKDFYLKMKHLWHSLESIHASFPIHDAAIEEGFLGKNVKSMNIVSRIRGVVLGFLLMKGIPLKSYSPREVKLAVTGSGNALKTQVNRGIKMLLDLKGAKLGTDESDALAVAYCHSLYIKHGNTGT